MNTDTPVGIVTNPATTEPVGIVTNQPVPAMTTPQHMAYLNAIQHEIHMRHLFQTEPTNAQWTAWECAKRMLEARTPR
jgi:hypothetical protein